MSALLQSVGGVVAASGGAPATPVTILGASLLHWSQPALGGMTSVSDGSGGEPANSEAVGRVPGQNSTPNMLQPTSGNRPTRNTTGDLDSISTNGTDQYMLVTLSGDQSAFYICAALEFTRVGAFSRMFAAQTAAGVGGDAVFAGNFALEATGSFNAQLTRSSAGRDSQAYPDDDGPFVLEMFMSPTQSLVAINGTGEIATHADIGCSPGKIYVSTGSGVATNVTGAMRLYDLVMANALPSTENRAALRALAAARAGL